MQDVSVSPPQADTGGPESELHRADAAVVSTHVLVSEEQVRQLRDLSRRTRVAQSEYLREAVDDLLSKYGRGEEPDEVGAAGAPRAQQG